jgi:signal transduction histidine kinase
MRATRRLLLAGAFYVFAYVLATAVLPRPEERMVRLLLAALFLAAPTLLALVLTVRAFRGSRGAERAFWGLLASSVLAHALNQGVYLVQELWMPDRPGLLPLAHFGYYSHFLLISVALLVRPDRSRTESAVRAEALEWLMAIAGGYFLYCYLVVLPMRVGVGPGRGVYLLIEGAPAVLAAVLSRRVREGPLRPVYVLLAAGLSVSAVAGALAYGLLGARSELYHPLDAAWVPALFALAGAALAPRAPRWVRSPHEASGRRRARVALIAVVTPPLLDGAFRLLAVEPALAADRSQLALVAGALLALLAALRIRVATPRAAASGPPDTLEARRALGEPSEFLQLASGVAHELNNPLMSIAGWTELALRRADAPAEELQKLLAATRRTAAAVARLQRLASQEQDRRGSLE